MRFILAGREYESVNLHEITVWEQLKMQETTGLSPAELERRCHELHGEPFRSKPAAVFESPRHVEAWLALVWLARRRAGERLTFEESSSFDLADYLVIPDTDVAAAMAEDPAPPDPPKPAAKRATSSRKRTAAKTAPGKKKPTKAARTRKT